jgi:DNA polymerase-3 subunit delta'
MNIIGHKKIINSLNKSIDKDNIHHAFLFIGPEHVGKFTVAMDFAQNILGDIAETNPDLIIIHPEIEEKKGITRKKAINIETIRETQRRASISPQNGKYKIIIIDDADYLNVASQNALLKTLEEPPRNVIIIIIVSNPEKLLPTIVSRCYIKKFNPVSATEMEKVLDFGKDRDEILFWSLGRPGLAINYISDKKEMVDSKADLEDFRKVISSDITERFSMAETWSKDTVTLIKKLSFWMILARRSIISEENYLSLSPQKSLIILDKIGDALETLKNTNSNARLLLENILLEI